MPDLVPLLTDKEVDRYRGKNLVRDEASAGAADMMGGRAGSYCRAVRELAVFADAGGCRQLNADEFRWNERSGFSGLASFVAETRPVLRTSTSESAPCPP